MRQNAVETDALDKKLLSLLYLDSRMSFKQLGKKMHLSSGAVERRLRQLQKNRVIQLLMANVNMTRLGLKSYRIYLKFDAMDEETENQVLALFENYSRTNWGVVCEGEYDVLWRIVAKDELEVENALNLLTEKFGQKIIEKNVVASTYQTYLDWNRAFGGTRHPALPLEKVTAITKIDVKDLGILAMVYGNARVTTVEIAGAVKLSPDAVQYRLRKLSKAGIIMGSTAWFDARKLGFEYYKLLIGFRSMTGDREKKFLEYCSSHDNVVFVNKCFGSWDMEVDIIVEDVVELHRFIREIKTRFGHFIGKHSYVAAIEERMLNPLTEYLPKKKQRD